MGITDEMRKYIAEAWDGSIYINQRPKRLLEIADRIDTEYQKCIRELNNLADAAILLPLGADGVPIHVGDVMENIFCPSTRYEVTGVGVGCFYAWGYEQERYLQFDADCFRHHKPETWERIIEDAISTHGSGFNPCWTEERDALVARCKALAGEEKEQQ
jgi:hypothetical protein